ncbi:hypothetical protein [Natronobacterium gregoryi]|uniref:Uncharacterized protein n=2 Tax=Natronobacterium gregoryi TaxID=44930 RepID=L0AFC2_NATGS|nr:hypothetical protein [Natronobacterium gregoryi]AFZ72593.1 hypothetical protein Natgr_1382 [Natronobacterium gregoryi SP2]SFJ57280.1 hypothetical protein SAMN05443661_1412 [Natronobacterium gregoryi]
MAHARSEDRSPSRSTIVNGLIGGVAALVLFFIGGQGEYPEA